MKYHHAPHTKSSITIAIIAVILMMGVVAVTHTMPPVKHEIPF